MLDVMRAAVLIASLTLVLAIEPALGQGIPTDPGPQTIPPTDIATGAAEQVTDTSAVVLGYFNYGATNPPGIAETCWFDYGITETFGRRQEAICSGTTKATLFPLFPGTTYHYRAGASNAAGTTYGPVTRNLTTLGTPVGPAPPPPPPTVGARLRIAAGQSLGSVLRRGLLLRVDVSEPCPCTVRTKLLVSTRTARRLHLGASRSIALDRAKFARG